MALRSEFQDKIMDLCSSIDGNEDNDDDNNSVGDLDERLRSIETLQSRTAGVDAEVDALHKRMVVMHEYKDLSCLWNLIKHFNGAKVAIEYLGKIN
jgi:hypothetical protein